MNNNLGKTLKKRRRERDLTLKAVTDMSGISASHLGRIERGERFPSASVLKKLADPLGFGETELLKLAGFISRDEIDDKLDNFKLEVKREIAQALVILLNKVDEL